MIFDQTVQIVKLQKNVLHSNYAIKILVLRPWNTQRFLH